MKKEAYATPDTIERRAAAWMESVGPLNRGARRFTVEPPRCALLMIDMQRLFLDPGSHAFLPAGPAIVPRVARLLAAFRAASRPCVFTRHAIPAEADSGLMGRWWGAVPRDGSPDADIVRDVQPRSTEVVLTKRVYDAFAGTGLLSVLRAHGVEQVVVSGVMTHLCCETTARSAFMHDLEVFFPADASAAPTEELHLSALRTLAHGFAVILKTDQVLERFAHA